MFDDLLSSTNKKYTLTLERFYEVKRKYLSLYKTQLLRMWDLGYTTEVSVFKKEDFLQSYSDEGVHLRFKEGVIKLESWVFYLEYLLSNKENTFYYEMYKLLKAKEDSESIDTVYDNLRMYKVSKTKPLSWGTIFGYSGMRGSSRSVVLGSASYDLLVSELEYVEEFEITSLVGIALSNKLGTDLSNIRLLKGISLEDVNVYLEDILQGGIILDNQELVELLNSKTLVSDVLSDLLYEYSDEIYSYLSSLNIYDRVKVLGLTNTHIYYCKDKDSSYKEELAFGSFSIDYDSGEVLSSINNYFGLTGDFVSLNDTTLSDGGNFVGCPFYLYGVGGSKSLYVDVEQVEGLGESSLIDDLGLYLTFSERGTYLPKEENSLVDFYLNSRGLAEEGEFIRYLTGNYSNEEKEAAIKQAVDLLGDT